MWKPFVALAMAVAVGGCGGASASPNPAVASACRERVATDHHRVIGRSLDAGEINSLAELVHTAFTTPAGASIDVSLLTDGVHDFYCVEHPDRSGGPRILTVLGMPAHYADKVDTGHPVASGPGLMGGFAMTWGAVDRSVARLAATWTWSPFNERRSPAPAPLTTEAVLANGYFVAVTTADGEWLSDRLVPYDAAGAVIPTAAPTPPGPEAWTPSSWPWSASAEGDPTRRSETSSKVFLPAGSYRVTFSFNGSATVGRPTFDPTLSCTATATLAPVGNPGRPVWELALAHDPASDPGGAARQARSFTVEVGTLYVVSWAWGCPWDVQIDRGPMGTSGA